MYFIKSVVDRIKYFSIRQQDNKNGNQKYGVDHHQQGSELLVTRTND